MDISKVKESSIEKYLAAKIKLARGVYIKLNANWYKGIPDRLVVFMVGTGANAYCRCAFVELKRPKGGRLSVAQKMWKKMLTMAGAEWHMLCTRDEIDRFMEGETW